MPCLFQAPAVLVTAYLFKKLDELDKYDESVKIGEVFIDFLTDDRDFLRNIYWSSLSWFFRGW